MKQTTAQSDDPTPKRAPAHERSQDETIKETLESIVIAFILAFVFRAYIVEAFVIPTGSMAPTLMGEHYRVTCDQCGYGFDINFDPDNPTRGRGGAVCPMCRYNIDMKRHARALPGDRILVHKYIYTLSKPRRWDVVVFKAPHDPNQNFIKRLVGLPNESIHLLDGNLYTQAQGTDKWRIARKSDRPKIQRAVWQPIYHSQYVPRDRGELLGPGERESSQRWSCPWVVEDGPWDTPSQRSYRFRGGEPGRISFDFQRGGHLRLSGVYPYNQYDRSSFGDDIEDIRLAVAVQPDTDDCSISLSTQTRLDGGPSQTVTATLQTDGTILLTASGSSEPLSIGRTDPLTPGRATSIEFWAVDQELSVWVDGECVLRYLYADELTFDQLVSRPPPKKTPRISIEMTGGPATLHRVELDRDLYYASSNQSRSARGGLVRMADGTIPLIGNRPMILRDNEFFCLGDNSPLSDDGRSWFPNGKDPRKKHAYPHAMWVREKYFNRAVNDDARDGIVPGKLMMGRAFFVYFPAPFPVSQNGPRVIPNFADMRFIH